MRPDPDRLAEIPLFETLSDAQRRRVADWLDVEQVSAGVRLAGEGAPGYSFFVLAEGEATVTVGGETLASLEPGDFFGEMAILGDGRRTATVTTTSPATVLVLFGTEFRRLEQELPEIGTRIEAAMQQRAGRSS